MRAVRKSMRLCPAREPVLPLQQPDLARTGTLHRAAGLAVDQDRTLLLLDARRRRVARVVAEPEMRPAQLDEGERGHAFGSLGHEALAVMFRVEPEAAHVAAA